MFPSYVICWSTFLTPDAFFGEMMRVSGRGYLTTPSTVAEKVFGWSKHLWFVSVHEGTLTLRPKDRPLCDPTLSRVFHSLHSRDASFRRFYRKNRDLFVVQY